MRTASKIGTGDQHPTPFESESASEPQLRQLFQAADGGDLVGHHLVALNSWDASTVQPKRFLRRRPSLPTTRTRRWLCWGSSATHRPWHTPEAGTVQMLSVFVVGRACVVSTCPSVSSKVWELSLSRCSRINTPPSTPNSGKPESDVRSVKTTYASPPSSLSRLPGSVSYTHLTLPTNA